MKFTDTNYSDMPMLNELRDYVHEELCLRNELLKGAFPITERIVTKQGSLCGVFFCLHGPRSVRITAVFDANKSRVYFYDSSGHRACSLPFDARAQATNN